MQIWEDRHVGFYKKDRNSSCCIVLRGSNSPRQQCPLKPPGSKPSFTDNGLTLTATGALAGLGAGDVLVNLAATANATATCTNPSGNSQPPGQNPAPVSVSGSQSLPASEVKNGNVTFTVTTNPPPNNPIAGAPGCPNSNWTETITDLAFTSATITVQQGAPPATELTISCVFAQPTKDGAVHSQEVTCSSQ
jgi:hypothetical protein